MTKRCSQATVVALLVFGSPTVIGGCSFVAVQAPRKDDRGRLEPAGCTTGMAAPAADAIITGVVLVGTMLAAGQTDESNGGLPQNGGPVVTAEAQMMTGAVATVLFGVSALYGLSTVGTCREASGIGPRRPATQVNAERRAEEEAEEAAVQARLKAKAAADAQAAPAANASGSAGATTDVGTNADAGAPPAVAPNQRRDDGR